jgi:hypothetical protein
VLCGLEALHGPRDRPRRHRCPHGQACYQGDEAMARYICRWCYAAWAVRQGAMVPGQPNWRTLVFGTKKAPD